MDIQKYNVNREIYINGEPLFIQNQCRIMAGPCAVENRDQILFTAEKLQKMGITVFRAGAFKPRTSFSAFRGAGVDGLKWLDEVKHMFGMSIITETSDSENFDEVASVADVIQIGAKAMYNYSVLKAAGRSKKPILLKRHFGAPIDEMIKMSEFIMAEGNKNIAFCERGIRSFEHSSRFTLDLCGAAYFKHMFGMPLILDPSHSMGYQYGVSDIAKACVAFGCEGILIEVHHDPSRALCDKEQAIDLDEFSNLFGVMKQIGKAVGRKVI